MKHLNETRRTPDQNDAMWSKLHDIARQVKWKVNGQLVYMSEEDWKTVFTAALNRHMRIAEGIEHGYVFLGMSTRRMTKDQMADLLTMIQAFGDERSVVWTEPTKEPA